MGTDQILKSNLKISSLSDDSGRRYYNIKVAFSDEDVLTIYRNSIDELLDDLPHILVSAIRARIVQEEVVC